MKVICIKSKSFNYFNFSEKDFIKGQIYNALDGTSEYMMNVMIGIWLSLIEMTFLSILCC